MSRSILDMPYVIARDRGFFREEGLEVEFIFMKAIQTVQAMLAGGVDFGTATGTAISAAVNGADVRVVFALTDKPSFDMIALPNITNVQQMRGKKLGISAPGSLTEILARQILLVNKIPLDQVTMLSTGHERCHIHSPKGGHHRRDHAASAAESSSPRKKVIARSPAGADVYRAVQGGLTTTKTVITERPEIVTRVIRATQRALRVIRNDKKFTVDFIKGPFLDLGKDRDKYADRVYDTALQFYLPSGVVDEKLQREMIATAAQRVKPKDPVPPERVFDFTFAQKVADSLNDENKQPPSRGRRRKTSIHSSKGIESISKFLS